MTGEQVVRVCRAVAKHLAAFADDLAQITTAPDRAAATDPQDTCKAGDPDPTPHEGPYLFCATASPGDHWMCTRAIGHVGQHVAGANGKVAAVWT